MEIVFFYHPHTRAAALTGYVPESLFFKSIQVLLHTFFPSFSALRCIVHSLKLCRSKNVSHLHRSMQTEQPRPDKMKWIPQILNSLERRKRVKLLHRQFFLLYLNFWSLTERKTFPTALFNNSMGLKRANLRSPVKDIASNGTNLWHLIRSFTHCRAKIW